MSIFRKMSPGKLILFGFAAVITLGAILLLLPISQNEGVEVTVLDAFFTATSAVCVTGLVTIDTADHFNAFGQIVVALLIQIGGLGVSSVGVGFILLARKKVSFKDRILVKEALNMNSMKGIVKMVKVMLIMTFTFETVGALLSYQVFSKDYPPLKALGISLFHSVSSFNNAGFDILGEFRSLTQYKDDVLLNLTTSGLIIFGGLGFIVVREMIHKHSFKKFSLHSKVVLSMTVSLLIVGTLLFKLTEDITWLGAFFYSTSARTAGFATYSVGNFSNAGLFALIILMFIGASPASTGGGIKTTTVFVLIKSAFSFATNRHCTVYKRKIPNEIIIKAFIITLLASVIVCVDLFLICIVEPKYTFVQIFFEVVSAFGTVGLSTGITPELSDFSNIIIMLTMFIGRLGPLTIATIWTFKQKSSVCYSEEIITVG